MNNYIKGKGVLVGTFTEEDIENNVDWQETYKKQCETGYRYTNCEFVMNDGKIAGIKVYVCKFEDMKI